MVSFTFAAMMTLAATEQQYELKYLSEVTKGKVIQKIKHAGIDKNDAAVKANKKCVHDLLDLGVHRDDIIDMCNNPRL